MSTTDTKIRPEFIRLPSGKERCPLTGVSRGYLWKLITAGKVRSKVIRDPGAVRGVRLILVDSLLDYIHGHQDADTRVDADKATVEGGAR